MKIPTIPTSLRLALGLCIFLAGFSQASAQATLFGVQIRASTPNFQLFLNINDDSTVANPNSPLFVLAGGIYGAAVREGATAVNNPNLYTIDPATGETTLVGNLGTILESLTWSSTLGLVGGFDHLYQINTSTGQATQIGTTDYTDGLGTGPAIFNGIYGLASSSVPGEIELTPFSITSASLNSEGQLKLSWGSETGLSFKVECNPSLDELTWVEVSESLSGQPLSMSYTITGPELINSRFYRIVKSFP